MPKSERALAHEKLEEKMNGSRLFSIFWSISSKPQDLPPPKVPIRLSIRNI